MTGRVLVLLTRSLLAAATTVAVLATPASATADGSDGLSGELLTLDLSGLSTCEPGATSHSFTATGDATGPVAGPVEATISTEVADGSRVSTIVFSVNGGELQGTQTTSGVADGSGACATPVDGTWSWSGTVGDTSVTGTGALVSGDGVLTDTLTSPAPPSPSPTDTPSDTPTDTPTDQPSDTPTDQPTDTPSGEPTGTPTGTPTGEPTPGDGTPSPQPFDPNVSFSYDAKPGPAGPIGTCQVTGGTTADPVKVRCLDVVRYHRSGTKVRFTGHAIQNGVATSYTITVADGRGSNPDKFLIRTGTGYAGGGSVTAGGLKVR
jgi:hypothetical protein